MTYSKHGGGCCGVAHVHDFPAYGNGEGAATRREKWLRDSIKDAVLYQYDTYAEGTYDDFDAYTPPPPKEEAEYIVEAVLASYQMSEWQEPLIKEGFKIVTVFENTNSGNTCHIFHLNTKDFEW